MSRETDELLRRARGAGRPTGDELQRARRGVDAKLAALGVGSAIALAPRTVSATGSIAPKAIGAALALKWGAAVVLTVGALAAIVVIEVRQEAPSSTAPPRAATVPTTQPLAPEQPPPLASATTVEGLPPLAMPKAAPRLPPTPSARRAVAPESASAAVEAVASPERASEAPREAAPPGSAAPPPARQSHDPLGEQIARIRRIDDALRAGQATLALTEIENDARLSPDGPLSEEREAARVLALCDLGRRDDARRAATVFRASHPRSTSEARLRRSCADAP